MPYNIWDGANGTASVTSDTTLMMVDMTGFSSIQVQVTDAGTGCTVSYETSNDSVNWVPTVGAEVGTISSAGITDTTTTGMWSFPRSGHYFRARVSSYASGTVTVYWIQSAQTQPVF